MKEAIKFYFDGYSSDELGLYNCTMNTGLYEESFLSDRQIREVQIRGRDEPYFQGVTRSPLSLTLTFTFKDTYDEEKIRFVARVLDQSTYKPFVTESNPDRIFYCILVSSPKLLHNGLNQGYVELEFRCNSPYSYSAVSTSEVYDLSNNKTYTEIEFINHGDLSVYPEIYVTMVKDGYVSIVNQSNGGQEFKFGNRATGTLTFVGNVSDAETVTIGDQIYEFDTNAAFTSTRIPVGIGIDSTYVDAISQLVSAINGNANSNVIAKGDTVAKKVYVTHKAAGVIGHIAVSTTCINAGWDGTTLTGGTEGLADNETVYVDCENQHIETDLSNTYRYDRFNNGFLEMIRGVNRLTVTGKCQLYFRYQFKTLQG